MNKLTIFFVGATVLVISITGTLLTYRYFERQQEQHVENQVEEPTTEVKSVISKKTEINADTNENINKIENIEEETDTPLIQILASIDLEKILNAGFENGNLKIEPFDGLIFNDYDISEYQDDEHIKYIITENNESAGIINELIYPSEKIATAVYNQLKAKMSQENSSFTINETNQYGDASFFANNSEETNSVFLVVKFGNRLYTLHYPAKNHNKMKNLLQSL